MVGWSGGAGGHSAVSLQRWRPRPADEEGRLGRAMKKGGGDMAMVAVGGSDAMMAMAAAGGGRRRSRRRGEILIHRSKIQVWGKKIQI